MRLPDHDFAIGSRHLLVPSVMAVCKIDKEGVSYNGETYVAVRSSKHNNSSAFTHQEDMLRMKSLMPHLFQNKSILIKAVDGGPDENPRFQRNQLMCLKTMQVIFKHIKRAPDYIEKLKSSALSSIACLKASQKSLKTFVGSIAI